MTFFKCGGVALGVARHHVLHDMRSANHFLQTWVSMTRGCTGADLPPPPFLDRTVLRARSPPVVQFDHPECIPKIINPSQTPGATTSISCAMKLSQDQINILKCSGKPDSTVDLSTFSVVAAHVWKCVCAAGGHGFSPENNARLILPVDVRNRVHPPLPQQYLGNAIIQTAVDERVDDVLLESVAGLAQKIKGALDRVDDSYVRSAIDCMELMHKNRKSFLTDDDKQASEFKLVNWLGMPTQGADFGWGPPKFMIRSHTASDNVALMKDDGAGISLQISLQRETMLKFKDLFYDIPCLDA